MLVKRKLFNRIRERHIVSSSEFTELRMLRMLYFKHRFQHQRLFMYRMSHKLRKLSTHLINPPLARSYGSSINCGMSLERNK
ncbi:unnamed protein product [Strongylus vulgaris]|uniref:Uncharacterized protein n=1 Tax=Strongylus vulgaris TaxID=40348 RepID=A0A3P7JQU9_STRVU|nr:unnamed protein product [Strongylus vulgaris]